MTKRIAHIIIGLNVGGAEMMLRRLVLNSHKKTGFEHSVISLTDLGTIGTSLEDEGIKVYSLGMSSTLFIPQTLFRLRRLLKKLQPDIVQTWMYHADFLGGLAAKSAGLNNIIWGIRTTDVTLARSQSTIKLRQLCAYLSYYVPKSIVSVADAGRQLHEKVGYDASKMKVIPNGFELDKLVTSSEQVEKLRKECHFSDSNVVIGSVGRFNKVKNQKLFVEAAALVVKKYPNARFLMVGRDNNWDNKKLVSWIKQYELKSKFVLLGERSDIPTCFGVMDIFCLHSTTEGFPNVLGEAMAMGLPCVTTDVGDAKLLLGEAGEVAASTSVSVCDKINCLISLDKLELDEIGYRAYQRIQQHYSLSSVVSQYEALYTALV